MILFKLIRTMFFACWTRAATITVLVNYVALLTLGQAFHDHGSHIGPSETRDHQTCCVHVSKSPQHCRLSEAESLQKLPSHDTLAEVGHSASPQLDRDHLCQICRFLSQKPIPAPTIRLVGSTPFVGAAEPLNASRLPTPSLRLFDVRGPPVIS